MCYKYIRYINKYNININARIDKVHYLKSYS